MNKEIFVISITNDVTLKKFSLKIPFKTFHASAEGGGFASAFGAYLVKRSWERVFRGILFINDF